jgi:hypothetical protein
MYDSEVVIYFLAGLGWPIYLLGLAVGKLFFFLVDKVEKKLRDIDE